MAKKKTENRSENPETVGAVSGESADGKNHVLERLSRRIREKSPNGHRIEVFDDLELMNNLRQANELYGRNLPGEARSSRPFWGRIITPIKRLVRRLTAWYVDPALGSQRDFNAYTIRSINEIKSYLDHLQINEDILSTIVHRDLSLFKANLIYLNKYLERRLQEFQERVDLLDERRFSLIMGDGSSIGAAPRDVNKEGQWNLTDIDTLYLEQKINGSTRQVRERQNAYVPFFRDCENVLVLGSGRGEFLGLLEGEDIRCRGVDWSSAMVDYCRDKDYPVNNLTPLECLEQLENCSIDGLLITGRVVDRRPGELVETLEYCNGKMKDGGVVVVESPSSASCPGQPLLRMYPEALSAIFDRCGFERAEIVDVDGAESGNGFSRMNKEELDFISDSGVKELFLQAEENFRRLEEAFDTSNRHYAVVAYKANGRIGT